MRTNSTLIFIFITIILSLTGLASAQSPTSTPPMNPVLQGMCCVSMFGIVAIILYLPYRSKSKAEAVEIEKVYKARAERDYSQLVSLMKSKYLGASFAAATVIEECGEAAIEPLLVHLPNQGYYKINVMRNATKPISICVGTAGNNTHISVDLSPQIIPSLIRCLALPKNSAYYGAVSLIKEFTTVSVVPLIGALTDPDPNIRSSAASILGTLSDIRAIEPLIAALRDNDQDVRLEAVRSLDCFDDPRTIGPLKELLKDPSRDVQSAALSALGDFSTELTGLPKTPSKPDRYNDSEGGGDEVPSESVVREREIIREIVKVPCKYCGTLVEITKSSCQSCGAPFKL